MAERVELHLLVGGGFATEQIVQTSYGGAARAVLSQAGCVCLL